MKMNILITGASRGIGKELAIAYGSRSHHLILIARNEEQLIENKESIFRAGGSADYIVCDVAKGDEFRSAIDHAYSKCEKIDIAILNAGIGETISFTDNYYEKLRYVFEVNFFSIANAMDLLVDRMKETGNGIIAGVGSLADFRGIPGSAAYSASKIALSHYLEAARIDLKEHNIHVITIKPGFVRTDMTAKHKYPMPFIMDADKAAKIIIDGIEKGKARISFPLFPSFMNYIFKLIPGCIFEKIIATWKERTK
jgi:short-subunit dehydrogenase